MEKTTAFSARFFCTQLLLGGEGFMELADEPLHMFHIIYHDDIILDQFLRDLDKIDVLRGKKYVQHIETSKKKRRAVFHPALTCQQLISP